MTSPKPATVEENQRYQTQTGCVRIGGHARDSRESGARDSSVIKLRGSRRRGDGGGWGGLRRLMICATGAISLSFGAPVAIHEASMAFAAPLSQASGTFKVVRPGVRTGSATTAKRVKAARRHRHRWFWNEASPSMDAADPLRAASLSERAAERIAGRRAQKLVREITETYRAEIAAAARGAMVSEALIAAVVAVESGGRVRARSPKGAQGLAQLMPGTAARLGVDDAWDPAQNLRGAADYLSMLLDMFNGDLLLALAGYNAGENAVLRYKGVPPYAETRDYVPKVLAHYALATRDCLFAPRTPRAPCVAVNLPD